MSTKRCPVAWRGAWAAVLAAACGEAACGAELTIERCIVSLVDEARVPAEEAGVLVELAVTEGTRVSKGDAIAKVNDAQPQVERKKAEAELAHAKKTAENAVQEKYAAAAKAVAEKIYDRKLKASKDTKAVSADELDELKLKCDEQALSIEKAQFDQELAQLTVAVKEAEVEAAKKAIERRLIRSPLDGVVLEVLKHRGEWVQPQEPIARVARIDELLVKGHVPIQKAPRALVAGQPVSVTVELEGGRKETFAGTIVFASPEAPGGDYLVHADVDNRQVDGEWLLPAGINATMTIQLAEPAGPPAPR